MLRFSAANAKTKALYEVGDLADFLTGKRKVYSLDLPAGKSCPGALRCKCTVVPRQDDPTRFTVLDGPHCDWRCFSASQEVQYPPVRKLRQHNFDVLRKMRGAEQCRDMILASLPDNIGVLRQHVSGDYFKLAYLQGTIAAAVERPDVLFYAYTKSLHFVRRITDMLSPPDGLVTPNFRLTASRGGKYDHLIEQLHLRDATVVFSVGEAEQLELAIDHDDSHAATAGGSFALLLHGTQPAGSDAGKALSTLKGRGSYARK